MVTMRGVAGVGMIISVHCKGNPQGFVLVDKQRPMGKLHFPELPVGTFDESCDFDGADAQIIKDKLGITINTENIIDLTEMVFQSKYQGVFSAPDQSSECTRLCCYSIETTEEKIEELKGKWTGILENDQITLKIVGIDDYWYIQ